MNIIDKKIRIAVVGCGRISKNHFLAIEKYSSDLDLVAVCDTNSDNLKKHTNHYSVPGYSDVNQMFCDAEVDLAAICTPSGLHPEHVIASAQNKVHAITEKPMATRWVDGKAMIEACDTNRVRLFVVKQNRFNSTIRLLRDAIKAKRFGRIHMVNVNVFWARPQEYYDSAAWRGTWEFDGGAFMNQASHYVDLLDWLVGPVESIHAYTATLARNIEVEDTGVMNIRWRSGALGSLNVTMLTHPKNLEGSVTIIGDKGTVRIGGVAANKIEHWEFSDSLSTDSGVMDSNYEVDSVYGHGHSLYYENVIRVLRGDAQADTDGREGLRSLELLVAAYKSSREGRRVSLPLEL
jgi:UDP-N-acetyl-2-amino-2-deoxyglucuronate dehydrogenase